MLLPNSEAGGQEEVPVRRTERGQTRYPAARRHAAEGKEEVIIIIFSVMVIFVINNFAQETVSHKPFLVLKL